MAAETGKFCRIPSEFVIRFGEKLPCDIYLKLSDNKVVKLSHKDDLVEMVKKYQAKGIDEVYADRKEFNQFVDFIKKSSRQNQFFEYSPKKSTVDVANRLNQGRKIVQESLMHLGVTESAVDLARDISVNSLKVMQSVPNIFSFFKKLASCEQEFLRMLLAGYTGCCILDNFSWQTSQIKEKIFLAAFLCELTLDEESLEQLAQWERGDLEKNYLSKKVLDHPGFIANLLQRGGARIIGQDVLTIVEQHHERPDKLGFPNGLGPEKMMPLTCIYIVARNFALLIEKNEFKDSKKSEILYQIEQRFKRGNYKKAAEALDKMFAA